MRRIAPPQVMMSSRTRQPEETPAPHFLGGAQSGNELCPRSHSLWQNRDLTSAQSPSVSGWLPWSILGDKHVWEAAVPEAKANVRGEECGALFPHRFLPHSDQFPSLIQIPHPAGHFRLRWRIWNTRKQLWFALGPNCFSWMLGSNFLT